MLGLFKLQEKKKSLGTNPVSYKISQAGHKGGGDGRGGDTPGQVAGCQEGLGEREIKEGSRMGGD